MEQLYKILILEDVPTDAELILYELKRASINYEYKRAENQEQYVAALQTFHPDIILADFSLPRFNALEALEYIKKINLIIPFILVTGSQSEEIAVECIKNGADDYLLKTSLTRLPTAFYNAVQKKKEMANRLLIEKQLRESEAHKTAILNTAADSIVTIDMNGSIDLFNFAAENMFGYSTQEIVGKSVSILIPDFEKVNATEELEKYSQKKQNGQNQPEEFVGRKRDGTIFFIEISVDKVVLSDKSFFVTIIRDITHRKLSEEKLKYKNRELNTFVYRVSHDLKGPIASILGLVEIANAELQGVPQALRYTKLIRQSAFKLDYTLVELLKVLHVREADVHYSEANVYDLIMEVFKSYSGLGYFENIFTKVEVDKNLKFNTAPDFLKLLLEKVILNSIHFRKDFSSENFIFIKAAVANRNLVIEIKDNGVGIEKNIQDKVFDMFFRGNNISKGSGLGLYLSKIVVDKLSGNIEIKSERDMGTTVIITLPDQERKMLS